jgi:hypothetical protein
MVGQGTKARKIIVRKVRDLWLAVKDKASANTVASAENSTAVLKAGKRKVRDNSIVVLKAHSRKVQDNFTVVLKAHSRKVRDSSTAVTKARSHKVRDNSIVALKAHNRKVRDRISLLNRPSIGIIPRAGKALHFK